MSMMIFFKRYFFILNLLSIVAAFSSCNNNNDNSDGNAEAHIIIPTQEELKEIAINEFVSDLSVEQKIAQLFLVSVDGTDAALSATAHPVPPGGFLLFSRNTKDGSKKIITLTGDTQLFYNEKSEVPPYFAIDHEGGEVNRLRSIASPLPSVVTIKNTLSPELAQELYYLSARQLHSLGIHINLGPVAEVLNENNEEVLSYRSFGNITDVKEYGKAFIDGFTRGGIYCVLKHFPGNTNDDPHYRLPILSGEKSEIINTYVKPFNFLLKDEGLLMSHIVIPAFDEVTPACLSSVVIEELVSKELNFDGLIFTDDILMSALSNNGYNYDVAIEMALKAGVNVLMISHPAYWSLIPTVIDKVNNDEFLMQNVNKSVKKILKEKVRMGLLEFIEVDETLELRAKAIESIYNAEQQALEFEQAKNEGLSMYNRYWAG